MLPLGAFWVQTTLQFASVTQDARYYLGRLCWYKMLRIAAVLVAGASALRPQAKQRSGVAKCCR